MAASKESPPQAPATPSCKPVRCPQQRGSSASNTAPRFLLFPHFLLFVVNLLAQLAGPAAVINGRPHRSHRVTR